MDVSAEQKIKVNDASWKDLVSISSLFDMQ